MTVEPIRVPSLLEACDDERMFGVVLTPKQRELLTAVAAADLLHVWCLGRRSGKTLLAVLVALYYCTLRPDLASCTRRRERRYAVAVATNLRQARIFVQQAKEVCEGSPFLRDLIDQVTEDEIRFKTGTALAAFPCTSRGGRGWPVMCLLLDEAAHMLDGEGNQAAESVYRALVPSVAQFGERARVIVASSPYGTDGFFAELFGQVEKGDLESARCEQAGTVAMRPELDSAAMMMERRRDSQAWRAEYCAEFIAAGGAFLDGRIVADAVTRRKELKPGDLDDVVAGVDLAFRRDSTGLVIVGRDRSNSRRLRVAAARSWSPSPDAPLGFTATVDEIADVCLRFRVNEVFLDQYAGPAAQEQLERRGLRAVIVHTTVESKSAMFTRLKERLYDGELELFQHPELLAELGRIETQTTPGRSVVNIRRLGASHGDLVSGLALAVSRLAEARSIPMRTFVARGTITADDPLSGRVHDVRTMSVRAMRRFGLMKSKDAGSSSLGLRRRSSTTLSDVVRREEIPVWDQARGMDELRDIYRRAGQ